MAGFALPLVNPEVGNPPASSMPSMPAAAPVAVAAPMAAPAPIAARPPMAAQSPGGLQEALKQLLPVLISSIAAKRGGAQAGSAVLTGYAQGMAKKHQDALEQQQMQARLDATNLDAQQQVEKLQQDKQFKLSQFIENITKQVNEIDDPATFAATVDLAEKTAQSAFGAQPGLIKNTLVFNDQKRLDKEKKAAKETVDAFLKAHPGVNLDEALAANVMIGSKKLSDIAALANYEPATLPSGQPFQAEPQIAPVSDEKTVAAQAVAEAKKAARMAGKPFTQTDATRVSQQAIKQFKEATRLSPKATGTGTSGGSTDVKDIASGIADGTLPPTLATQGNAKERFGIAAQLKRNGINLSKLISNWLGTQRAITSLNSNQQIRLVENIDKASDSLDKVEELNQQLTAAMPRGKYKTLNRAALAVAKSGAWGQPAAQAANLLEGQIADLTAEMANVYMGGNSPTDHGLELAQKNLNSSWDEVTLSAAIQQARYNLNLAQNSRNDLLGQMGVTSTQFGNTTPPTDQARIRIKLADGTTGTIPAGTPIPAGATVIK